MTDRGFARENLRLVAVTSSMWNAIQPEILEIEKESFPPSLADEEAELRNIVDSPTGIFTVVNVSPSSKVLGYIAADLIERFSNIPGTVSDQHFNKGDTIYIESVAVHPDWRRHGIATILLRNCLRRAAQRGLNRATAHVVSGSASRLGLGARVLGSFENWYETGRTFDYIEIPIERQ